jgi:hypothetical protein
MTHHPGFLKSWFVAETGWLAMRRSARRVVWWQLSNPGGLGYNLTVEEIDDGDQVLVL